MRHIAALMASILVATPMPVSAEQIIAPGQFEIAGTPFTCWKATTVLFERGPDVAMALHNRIDLNWPVFTSLPVDVQAFIYAHECAHAHYGYNEAKADCWAIKVGKEQGFLNSSSVGRICQAVYLSPGDWTHFPGPARCQLMAACFADN